MSNVSESTTERDSRWWLLLLPTLVLYLGLFVTNVANPDPTVSLGDLLTSVVPSWLALPLGLAFFVAFAAPATVAIAVHFDRKFVAAVSDWEPRSEYVLVGFLSWVHAGVGSVALLWYLYQRHEYVGTP